MLHMSPLRLPQSALFSVPQMEWKKYPGGQQKTWQREMDKVTVGSSRVESPCLLGWDLEHSSARWPYTLKDMAIKSVQWRGFCYLLSGQIV